MTTKPVQDREILGYTLKERIGAGGYGEVWSAEAPGGLMKAIKFVYGFHDEKRAQSELKALDRVKEVRHPFLLSLERIEVFEGQLVVVTELADMSLADLFNEYADKGEPGIPREKLLEYMREAADALDYLSDSHKLQHLDIKPENLLMVSGHVKVADFGLIKDLQDASQSLMTGMTPAYAAPELFDGTPGSKSDQYSLAIVYQEMLTAIRPFPGTTPAQLAAQHMHGRPNLRSLPKSDQPIVAKALSKNPEVRFASCRAMVDELINRKLNKRTIRRIGKAREEVDTQAVNTVEIDNSTNSREVTAVVSSNALPFQSVEIKPLTPPDCDTSEAGFRPTIILSIGNTANQASVKIKERLVARHGSVHDVPSVKVLCFDSDRNGLSELANLPSAGKLSDSEIVQLPLFKPEVYRERAKTHLGWLSRRWIYNVPRTLQTEGLRPLGRLAFADHFETICDKLRTGINDITREENVAATSEKIEVPPAEDLTPRVFIISSISGGIGSGMTLDLAYTVKSILAENGFSTDSVSAILLHSTNRRSRDAGLSSANAFAFLTELRHFNDFGFPGDPSLGIPEFSEEPPLDYAYFLDLGLDLKQTEFDGAIDSIAEYVYLNSVSKCSVFFDKCRAYEKDMEHFALRTFGLSISGPGNHETATYMSNQIASELLSRWRNGADSDGSEEEENVRSWFDTFELHFDGIANHLGIEVDELLGDRFSGFSLEATKNVMGAEPQDAIECLTSYFDNEFGAPPQRVEVGQTDPEICGQMDEKVATDAQLIADQLANATLELIAKDSFDLSIPTRVTQNMLGKLEAIRNLIDKETACCIQQLTEVEQFVLKYALDPKPKPEATELVAQAIQSYCQFRQQEFVLRYAKEYCRIVRSGVVAAESMVNKLSTQLGYVDKHFQTPEEMAFHDLDVERIEQLMIDSIYHSRKELIDRIEIQVYQELIASRGGYLAAMNETGCWQNELPGTIRHAALCVLADACKKISIDKLIDEHQVGLDELVKWLNQHLNLSRPKVSQCGGGTRLMCGMPMFSKESNLPDLISRQFGVTPAQLNGTSGDFVLCFECEDVALAHVAYTLLEHRPDAAQLSQRIHTRKDIEWTSLNDLL